MKTLKELLLDLDIFEDNIYLDFYCDLINLNLNTSKQKYITNIHHIIPKCYYKYNNLTVNENESNKVNLIYSDHILAHYYLYKCCSKNKIIWFKLMCSLTYLLGEIKNEHNYENKLPTLEELKLLLSDYDKFHEDYMKEMSAHKQGCKLPHDEDWNTKISLALKGRKLSDDHIKHCKEGKLKSGKEYHSTLGRKCIYNIELNKKKYVRIEDLDFYLSQGWKLGMLPYNEDYYIKHKEGIEKTKNSKNCWCGRKWFNNGKIQVHSFECPEGFVPGMLKNKNRKPKSEEQKRVLKGKIIVNKNNVIKYIDKNDLELYLKEGWKRGRK